MSNDPSRASFPFPEYYNPEESGEDKNNSSVSNNNNNKNSSSSVRHNDPLSTADLSSHAQEAHPLPPNKQPILSGFMSPNDDGEPPESKRFSLNHDGFSPSPARPAGQRPGGQPFVDELEVPLVPRTSPSVQLTLSAGRTGGNPTNGQIQKMALPGWRVTSSARREEKRRGSSSRPTVMDAEEQNRSASYAPRSNRPSIFGNSISSNYRTKGNSEDYPWDPFEQSVKGQSMFSQVGGRWRGGPTFTDTVSPSDAASPDGNGRTTGLLSDKANHHEKESRMKKLKRKMSSFFFGNSKTAASSAVENMLAASARHTGETPPNSDDDEFDDEDDSDTSRGRRVGVDSDNSTSNRPGGTSRRRQREEMDSEEEASASFAPARREKRQKAPFMLDSVVFMNSPNGSPMPSPRYPVTLDNKSPLAASGSKSVARKPSAWKSFRSRVFSRSAVHFDAEDAANQSQRDPQMFGVSFGHHRSKSFTSTNQLPTSGGAVATTNQEEAPKRKQSVFSRKQSTYSVSALRNRTASKVFGSRKSLKSVAGTKLTVDLEAEIDVDALLDEIHKEDEEEEMASMAPGASATQDPIISLMPAPQRRKSHATTAEADDDGFQPMAWTSRQFQHNMARAIVHKDAVRFSRLLFLYSVLQRRQEEQMYAPSKKPPRVVLITEEDVITCKRIPEKYIVPKEEAEDCPSILDQVLDPDTGYTLMHLAVLAHKQSILSECLRFGSQTHQVRDVQGDTPLTLAMKRYPTAVPLLFSLGEKVNVSHPIGPWEHSMPDDEDTRAALEAGVGWQGQNLLHCCVSADENTPKWKGRLAFMKMLVEQHQVRTSQEDLFGFTPLLWILQNRSFIEEEQVEEIIKYLRQQTLRETEAEMLAAYGIKPSEKPPTDDLPPGKRPDPTLPPGRPKPEGPKKDTPGPAAPAAPAVAQPSAMVRALAKAVGPDTRTMVGSADMHASGKNLKRLANIPRMPLYTSRVDHMRYALQGPPTRLICLVLLLAFHIIEYTLDTSTLFFRELRLEPWGKVLNLLIAGWNGSAFFMGLVHVGCLILGIIIGILFFVYFLGDFLGVYVLQLPCLGARSAAEMRILGVQFGPYMQRIYRLRRRGLIYLIPMGTVVGMYAGALIYNVIVQHQWAGQARWAVLPSTVGHIRPIMSLYILFAITLGLDWYCLCFVCDMMYQQGAMSINLPHYRFDRFANGIDTHLRRIFLGPLPEHLSMKHRARDARRKAAEHDKGKNKSDKKKKEIYVKPLQMVSMESFRVYAFWFFVFLGWVVIALAFSLVCTLHLPPEKDAFYIDTVAEFSTVRACMCVLFASFAVLFLCLIALQEWTWPTFQVHRHLSVPGTITCGHHAWLLLLLLSVLLTFDVRAIVGNIQVVFDLHRFNTPFFPTNVSADNQTMWVDDSGDGHSTVIISAKMRTSLAMRVGSCICVLPAAFGVVFFIVALLSTSLRCTKPCPPPVHNVNSRKSEKEEEAEGTLCLLSRAWQSYAYGEHLLALPVPGAVGLLHYNYPDLPLWRVLEEGHHYSRDVNMLPTDVRRRTLCVEMMPVFPDGMSSVSTNLGSDDTNSNPFSPNTLLEKPDEKKQEAAVQSFKQSPYYIDPTLPPPAQRQAAVTGVLFMLEQQHLLEPVKELNVGGRGYVYAVDDADDIWSDTDDDDTKPAAATESEKRKQVKANGGEDFSNPLLATPETDGSSKVDSQTAIIVATQDSRHGGLADVSAKKKKHSLPVSTLLTRRTNHRERQKRFALNPTKNSSTLREMRVVQLRRRRQLRKKQLQYHGELLAFSGVSGSSRRRVLDYRKREEKYIEVLRK